MEKPTIKFNQVIEGQGTDCDIIEKFDESQQEFYYMVCYLLNGQAKEYEMRMDFDTGQFQFIEEATPADLKASEETINKKIKSIDL